MSYRYRTIVQTAKGTPTSDGAGVSLVRVIGSPALDMHDPFLLLDEFGTDNPDDYIAGFPSHPHRGFETVTYMLEGYMKHEDSTGAAGILGPGGVQWMTAGSGVIHSEMPQQKEGAMRGFQLWVNLPAADKMTPPRYQNIEPEEIPVVTTPEGVVVKVIAGELDRVTGPVSGVAVQPVYLDVILPESKRFGVNIPDTKNLFAYLYDGNALFRQEGDDFRLNEKEIATFGEGERVEVAAADGEARLILVAGRPMNEPVARYGPFVMNTREEISQAINDLRTGEFIKEA